MNIVEVIILISVVLVNAALLGVVYTRDSRSATHRLFALLTLAMSAYLISNFLAVNTRSDENVVWFVRFVMFFAAPLSTIFFLLMHTFPSKEVLMSRRALWIWISLTAFTMALALSPYLFTSTQLVSDGPPVPKPGPGMILFLPIGVGTIPLGLYYLIRKLLQAKGQLRTQIKLMLSGATVMFGLIIAFIFVGAVVFGNPFFAQYAPLFTLPFVGLTAYAIVRHGLFNVRVLTAQALTSSLLIVALAQLITPNYFEGSILRIIFIVLVAVIGVRLIQSVKKEDESSQKLVNTNQKLEGVNAELHQLTEKLQTANNHLEQLLRIKTEFLQIASHQLRTPVSVMRGVLDMLSNEKDTPLTPTQRIELIDSAHAKSEKLKQVIDDILSATEMDEPAFDLSGTAKQIDLRELAKHEFGSHKADADMKGIALTFEPSEETLPIQASETYLPQAMSNLIDNAIKYTAEGSVTVKVYPEDNYAVFAVQDTGMGVPEEDMDKLWTKFQRAGNAKNAYTDGSGLGLFIIKKIVEGHQGGQVFAESKAGQGSTFGFKLPKINRR